MIKTFFFCIALFLNGIVFSQDSIYVEAHVVSDSIYKVGKNLADRIKTESLMQNLRALASDRMLGRASGN